MSIETEENTNPNPEFLDELTLLKQRAEQLGITYHHKLGLDKLRTLVNEKLNPGSTPKVEEQVEISTDSTKNKNTQKSNATPLTQEFIESLSTPSNETDFAMKARLRKEANKLVRIRVACMNPNKKEHEGEIFTCGNSIVGTVKKYVPFNNEAGWHVPQIIYQMMSERQCQIFFTTKNAKGQKVKQGKLIKEFAIEVLPDLTKGELDELAAQQALAHNIDN